jgi:hypothetical protein
MAKRNSSAIGQDAIANTQRDRWQVGLARKKAREDLRARRFAPFFSGGSQRDQIVRRFKDVTRSVGGGGQATRHIFLSGAGLMKHPNSAVASRTRLLLPLSKDFVSARVSTGAFVLTNVF